jgi:hypothetical protein
MIYDYIIHREVLYMFIHVVCMNRRKYANIVPMKWLMSIGRLHLLSSSDLGLETSLNGRNRSGGSTGLTT